jgi:hypothetical protein
MSAETKYPLKRSLSVLMLSWRKVTTKSLEISNIAAIPNIDQDPPEKILDIPNTE